MSEVRDDADGVSRAGECLRRAVVVAMAGIACLLVGSSDDGQGAEEGTATPAVAADGVEPLVMIAPGDEEADGGCSGPGWSSPEGQSLRFESWDGDGCNWSWDIMLFAGDFESASAVRDGTGEGWAVAAVLTADASERITGAIATRVGDVTAVGGSGPMFGGPVIIEGGQVEEWILATSLTEAEAEKMAAGVR